MSPVPGVQVPQGSSDILSMVSKNRVLLWGKEKKKKRKENKSYSLTGIPSLWLWWNHSFDISGISGLWQG